MANDNTISVSIVKGCEGLAIYLNDCRICGSKPWGGGVFLQEWANMPVQNVIDAIGESNLRAALDAEAERKVTLKAKKGERPQHG